MDENSHFRWPGEPSPAPPHRAHQGAEAARRYLAAGLVLAALAWLAPLAGCAARPLPPEEPASLLYRDLERLVTVKAASGWTIDRLEIDSMLPDALMSACQVAPRHHGDLLAWLDRRIVTLGGPVEDAYHARGGDLGEVRDLLILTRVRMMLARAAEAADSDCPFWVSPDPSFAGRQISDDRWQLSLGGGGRGNVFLEGGTLDVEVGGASRLLFGRVIGDSLGLYAGLEVGGGGSAPKNMNGDRTNLQLVVESVAPVVVRHYLLNTFIEGEFGYLARTTENDWGNIEHGVHIGVFVGARATRVRWFFPGAGFGISYERTFPNSSQGPALNMLKLGFRASFDIDL